MNYKFIILIIFVFLNSCANQSIDKKNNKQSHKSYFATKGFTLIYNDNLYKEKVIKSKIEKILINYKDQGKTIAGFGAARSGTTLITQMGIGKLLDFIVDDNPEKQGKFTPGDHILVRPTKDIYEKKPDYIFILAWIHSKTIIKNNKRYLDEGGHFIICFPEIKIIGKK